MPPHLGTSDEGCSYRGAWGAMATIGHLSGPHAFSPGKGLAPVGDFWYSLG